MDLKNKNILITGASSGIGKELAVQLSQKGCNLILIARRKELLDSLADEIKNSSIKILTVKCDVSDRAEIKSALGNIFKEFTSVDVAILNAGTDKRITMEESDASVVDRIYGVNILGLIYCTEELLSQFKKKGSGTIVGISSLAEVRGFPQSSYYCSSKAAVSVFLESIRVELKSLGIKVSTVKPGFVKTSMTDKNKFYMPFLISVNKAAKIIIKGIEKEKRIIQFPFLLVPLAKLVKILPDSLFDFLSAKVKN